MKLKIAQESPDQVRFDKRKGRRDYYVYCKDRRGKITERIPIFEDYSPELLLRTVRDFVAFVNFYELWCEITNKSQVQAMPEGRI